MQLIPVSEMNAAAIEAEVAQLEDALPSMRHMPTITLDKALVLLEQTRYGATPEQATRLQDLLRYSAAAVAKFEQVKARIAELRAAQPTAPEATVVAINHPVLTDEQVAALVGTQRAFRNACDCFVSGNNRRNPLAAFELQALDLRDAEALELGAKLGVVAAALPPKTPAPPAS